MVEQGKLPIDELGIKSKVTNELLTEDDKLEIPQENSDSDTFKQGRRSTNGRPPGAKDSKPRQRNRSKPVLRASKIWSKSAQKNIADVINPIFLQAEGKKNMRSLDSEQSKLAEYLALGTLFNLQPEKFTEQDILAAHASDYNESAIIEFRNTVKETETQLGRSLTADEKRDVAAEIYSYMV